MDIISLTTHWAIDFGFSNTSPKLIYHLLPQIFYCVRILPSYHKLQVLILVKFFPERLTIYCSFCYWHFHAYKGEEKVQGADDINPTFS